MPRRGRSRSRSRSRSRRRRRRRRRSPSHDVGQLPDDGRDHGRGLKPRHRDEKRHRSLWDVGPEEAEKHGLLKGLPISIGANGDFMHADRAGRRIYVGNLPLHVKEMELRDFFNAAMVAAQGPDRKPGDSVLGVFLNLQKRFAFVEFRSALEGTQAMELDGILFRGLSLKLGRPANWNPSAGKKLGPVPKLNIGNLGIISHHVPNGPNKLYIGGIPFNLKEAQVRELLETYGPLRALFLSFDPLTDCSKGYAFAYYQDDEQVTDAAIQGLNGIQIGDRTLVVRRQNDGQQRTNDSVSNLMSLESIVKQEGGITATKTLCLMNMVSAEELGDPEEVADITEDVKNECTTYGNVKDILVPGLNQKGEKLPGAGKIFVKFDTVEQASACKSALTGRTFGSRTVVVSYYDEEKFDKREII